VVAELRAAGFDVVVVAPDPEASESATIVSVERIGDSVVVHATRDDGELEAELLEPGDQDGMTNRDATALRTAEAIRSLVTTPGKKPKADEPEAPPSAHPLPPEPPPIPDTPPVPDASWSGKDDVEPLTEVRDMPVFRMGLFSGGGMLTPSPALVLGASARLQLAPKLNIAAVLMGSKNVGDTEINGFEYDVWGARGSVLMSWEILGADNVWTPSLGGGVFGEFRYWEMTGSYVIQQGGGGDCGADTCVPIAVTEYATLVHDGAMAGAGASAKAGISVARPFRFRFDVHADLRMLTVELDGSGHDQMAPALAPSILGTFGIEYDFVTRRVVEQTAKR
jgi:hypothetical protein